MRVVLIHNAGAGSGRYTADDMAGIIRQAGHRVALCLEPDRDLAKQLESPVDLVAVAGGDGTVAKTARQLVRQEVPMTILPAGTANNVAHSLGIDGELEDLVAGWDRGTLHPLDAGRARHPWGEQVFFESAGLGLVAEAMCRAMDEERETGDRFAAGDRFDRDFRFLKLAARDFAAEQCRIRVDEDRFDEDVLLCEIMNSRQIGSRMVLAPGASTGDGLLDMVLVSRKDRELLRAFLDRDAEDDHPPHLPVRRGRVFEIVSRTRRIHLADTIERFPRQDEPWALTVEVIPGAVQVLVPSIAD